MLSNAESRIIDIEALDNFILLLDSAEQTHNKALLKQLRAEHSEYLWSTLKKNADKGDAKSAAYVARIMQMAGNSKTFGYKNQEYLSDKTLAKIDKYYTLALKNAQKQNYDDAQVNFCRAIFRYHNKAESYTLCDVSESRLFALIGQDIRDAAFGAYKPAQYLFARIQATKEAWGIHRYMYKATYMKRLNTQTIEGIIALVKKETSQMPLNGTQEQQQTANPICK